MNSQIQLINVSQQFSDQGATVHLFSNLNLVIQQGRSYAITGPSGSGKSSLLMIMAGLEQPHAGRLSYFTSNTIAPLDSLRRSTGFVFQQFHLLPELSALHNVALPLKLRGDKYAEEKAEVWLAKVGLANRMNHKPTTLSGGEQQRVALARALVFEPKYIFADEPTGNLDANSAHDVADLLFSCCEEQNAALVVVTHCQKLARRAQRVFNLEFGHCGVQRDDARRGALC
ncbi:ABC transporter ATP-binding protein [Alteromonas ponticola]|uniref:ABC transporter ATP-binding protein n=1 Tax=Alteromonas aquimaris TaxID=2998417 RepID=A0ABT3P8C3_9ALTE|nr:ABC transporter ATP-binding protein [Alteromonas aquimaris]MCW8109012.1 ABC transporter ATP-binding protein [Alteromonas aquimaris]